MFEYLLGDIVAKGHDVIVSSGQEDANHTSQLVACANKLGIDVVLVFFKRFNKELAGNALLINLLDAVIIDTEIEPLPHSEEEEEELNRRLDEIVDDLRKHGRHPYKMWTESWEPSAPLNLIGYFYCVQEIMQQLKELGETAQYIYVAHASGASQGGLLLGSKYFQAPFKVIGISTIPGYTPEGRTIPTIRNVNMASEVLGANITVEPNELILRDEYIGPESWGAFGRGTKKSIEAIRLVARNTGTLLDPHYTGKAMTALLDDIRQGKLSSTDTVIFYFTGGVPNIFSYAKELQIESRDDIKMLYKEK
jgi:D-cysteine desulfhydrase